jgi:hypothetical protein
MILAKVIAITDKLIELLQLEKKYLKQRKLSEAGMLHAEKDRLNGDYHLAVSQLKRNQGQISDESLEALKIKTIEFKTLLEDNRELLSSISQVNSRIISELVDRLAARAPAVDSYSSQGLSIKGRMPKGRALTLNTCV